MRLSVRAFCLLWWTWKGPNDFPLPTWNAGCSVFLESRKVKSSKELPSGRRRRQSISNSSMSWRKQQVWTGGSSLHRPCSWLAPRGKNWIGMHTPQKSSNSLSYFCCSNSWFSLETGIVGHQRLFLANWQPKAEKKNAKTSVFRHRWQAWKVVRSITAVRQRRRTPSNWRCSFAFFESFLWHFNERQHAEMIFRRSRLFLCKNQENGTGKQ